MQDVGGVGGSKPLTPEKINDYKQDYQKSFDLFQNALKEYSKPHVEYHKKAQLKKVMNEALQVMNQTACVALTKEKQAHESSLEKDYTAYIESPSSENRKKLADDINQLK